MRLGRVLGSAALVLAVTAACGCGKSYQEQYVPHVEQACASGHGDDCWFFGEMWMGKASWSYWPSWHLEVDKNKARAAYVRGCELGSVRACAAALERHVLDDRPDERAKIQARLAALGGEALSDDEVAAEDAELEEACKTDGANKSQADREATRQAIQQGMAGLNTGVAQINNRLAQSEAAKAQRRSRTGTHSSSTTPSGPRSNGTSKTPAPVASLTPGTGHWGTTCTPDLGRGCDKNGCCHEQSHDSTVACENDLCCMQAGQRCTVAADCCQKKAAFPLVCEGYQGGEPRCCRPAGTPCAGDCRACCNGADTDKHHGDPTLSTCL